MPFRQTLILALLTLLLSPLSRAAEPSFERLVASLAAPDRDAREQAVSALQKAGLGARPALLQGSRSTYPEIRARSIDLLMKLPWFAGDDPPEIRRVLENYGNHDVNGRKNVIRSLEALSIDPARIHSVLGRLFLEEPSEAVQWAMTPRLREFREALFRSRLREIDFRGLGAPVVALAGVAWIEKDLEQARLRLERACELVAQKAPTNPMEASFVFETLRRLYVGTRRFDEAAAIQRRWIEVASGIGTGGPPAGVAELFALHAQHGPLRGIAADVLRNAPFVHYPEILYALSHAMERGAGSAASLPVRWAAFSLSTGVTRSRQRVAEFLGKQDWQEPRRFELLAMLRHDARTVEIKEFYDCNAHFDLAVVAIRRGRDYAAAEHYRKALALLDRSSQMSIPRRGSIEAEMQWRYLRAARAKNDLAELEARVTPLIAPAGAHHSMALDVVPVLKALKRHDEAKKVFDEAYAAAKKRLDANPDSTSEWNHVAWLCARCGERLDEALKLASAAVEKEPGNAAYLDTAAEVNFRLGNRTEAIRLESRALELRPNDSFMIRQLKRFRGEFIPPGPEPE